MRRFTTLTTMAGATVLLSVLAATPAQAGGSHFSIYLGPGYPVPYGYPGRAYRPRMFFGHRHHRRGHGLYRSPYSRFGKPRRLHRNRVGCRPVSKLAYDRYGQRVRIGGAMCYDRYGRPYIVRGSRHLISHY